MNQDRTGETYPFCGQCLQGVRLPDPAQPPVRPDTSRQCDDSNCPWGNPPLRRHPAE